MQTTKHIPVMLEQSINGMNIQKKGIYIDATYGFGGHSNKILSLLDDESRLFAVDKDINSIKVAEKALLDDKRFSLKHGCFSSLGDYSKKWGIYGAVNGILFDLGVSSEHLDNPERGFSFRQNGPIDMRFDQSCGLSACEWIDSVDEQTLCKIIKRYGEERYSKRIAREIIYHREKEKINNTHDLVKVIDRAIPKNEKNKHNATRTFQAIRIFINNELEKYLTRFFSKFNFSKYDIKNIIRDTEKFLEILSNEQSSRQYNEMLAYLSSILVSIESHCIYS